MVIWNNQQKQNNHHRYCCEATERASETTKTRMTKGMPGPSSRVVHRWFMCNCLSLERVCVMCQSTVQPKAALKLSPRLYQSTQPHFVNLCVCALWVKNHHAMTGPVCSGWRGPTWLFLQPSPWFVSLAALGMGPASVDATSFSS